MDAYRCATCSRTFKRNWHLTRHEQSHSTERPFKCPLCVRVFARQDTLSRHLSSHAKARIRKSSSQNSGGFRNSLSSFSCTLSQNPETNVGSGDSQTLERNDSIETNQIASPLGSIGQSEQLQSVINLHESAAAVGSPVSSYATQSLASNTPGAAEGTRAVEIAASQLAAGEPNRAMSACPAPAEFPDELYSSTVDLHARSWLRDICGLDNRVTAARPDE